MFDRFFAVYTKFGSCVPCSSMIAIKFKSANVVVTQKQAWQDGTAMPRH